MTETIYDAIPVTYKGTQFRSKMERRIARLLDNLAIDWEYEPMTENGFTPDFKIGDDMWIEVKYLLRGEGLHSDADKIERFAKNHHIIIGGALPERQYCNDWDSLVRRIEEISKKCCPGYNPYNWAPWNDGFDKKPSRGDYTTILLAITTDGDPIKIYTESWKVVDVLDKEKTLWAYYDATTYVFEAITEKQQETIEQLQEENKQLKKNGLKLKTKKGETKSARLSLLFKPSVKDGIKEIAWKHHLSFNDFIHQVCEKILDGEIQID